MGQIGAKLNGSRFYKMAAGLVLFCWFRVLASLGFHPNYAQTVGQRVPVPRTVFVIAVGALNRWKIGELLFDLEIKIGYSHDSKCPIRLSHDSNSPIWPYDFHIFLVATISLNFLTISSGKSNNWRYFWSFDTKILIRKEWLLSLIRHQKSVNFKWQFCQQIGLFSIIF